MRKLTTLLWRAAQSGMNALDRPYRLTFSITDRCACQCRMCGIWKRQGEDELSCDEIDAIFAHAGHFSWINLTGGEPLIREDIGAVVRTVVRRNPRLYMLNFPTSGMFPAETRALVKDILNLLPLPRLLVTVSIDGPPELHDRLRGVDGCWERAVTTYKTLRALRSSRFDVLLGYTLQKANLHCLQETIAAIRNRVADVSLDEFHFNLAHVSENYYRNADFCGLPEYPEAADFISTVLGNRGRKSLNPVAYLERRYLTLARKYLMTGRSPLPCQAAAASMFMDAAGIVYACTSMGTPIGSLREEYYNLNRLYKGERWKRVRDSVTAGDCPHCWTPCEAYQVILAHPMSRFRSIK